MLPGLGRYIVREFRSRRSAVLPPWLSPSMVLCYLVLLKAHLKISRLCKWALRRLKKESPDCAGQSILLLAKGRRSQPDTDQGGMLPFLQTHQANNCLVLGIIDCLVREV